MQEVVLPTAEPKYVASSPFGEDIDAGGQLGENAQSKFQKLCARSLGHGSLRIIGAAGRVL
jgi:hypothetical protein